LPKELLELELLSPGICGNRRHSPIYAKKTLLFIAKDILRMMASMLKQPHACTQHLPPFSTTTDKMTVIRDTFAPVAMFIYKLGVKRFYIIGSIHYCQKIGVRGSFGDGRGIAIGVQQLIMSRLSLTMTAYVQQYCGSNEDGQYKNLGYDAMKKEIAPDLAKTLHPSITDVAHQIERRQLEISKSNRVIKMGMSMASSYNNFLNIGKNRAIAIGIAKKHGFKWRETNAGCTV